MRSVGAEARAGPSRRPSPRRPDREAGQATVELALALPVVVLALLLVVQVAVVGRAQVLVVDAAREGARVGAVGSSVGEITAAARATPGLDPARVRVHVERHPDGGDPTVSVTVTYVDPTDVALVGGLVGDKEVTATVTMRLEESG